MIKTSKKKFLEILDCFKFKAQDYIIIHSSLFIFGKVEGGIEFIFKTLKERFGQNHTIVIPTYTYSYRRNETFDPKKSPSDNLIGALSEKFRKSKNSYRNNDPLFSHCADGIDKKIIKRTSKKCFGNKSVFCSLFNKNATILSLGVEFTHGITEFLHIERMFGVPYRYERLFRGKSIINNKVEEDYCYHFVKKENFFKKYKSNRELIGKKLVSKKICKKVNYGYGSIFTINCQNMLDFTFKELKKNPLLMVEKIKY